MIDADTVRAFLEEVGREFGSSYVPDPSPAINALGSNVTALGYKMDQITGQLQVIADVISKAGANLFESTVVMALQTENGALLAENTALLRRQRQLIQVVKDLATPCVGCKKDKWQPHAPDCDWSSDVFETLDELANGTTIDSRTHQAAG